LVSLPHFCLVLEIRRKVPVGPVETGFRELIREAAQKLDLEILALEIMPDHLHLFVNAPPTLSPHDIVAHIKGLSSHHLCRKFTHVTRMPSMWTRSYFVSTAGNVSSDMIRKYIGAQRRGG